VNDYSASQGGHGGPPLQITSPLKNKPLLNLAPR
jgi:hypothetical protein